jgi:hypothetical protein
MRNAECRVIPLTLALSHPGEGILLLYEEKLSA